jgi:hypothetical protein
MAPASPNPGAGESPRVRSVVAATRPIVFAILLTAPLLTACALFDASTRTYEESSWYSGSEDVLWDVTLDVLDQEHEIGDFDPVAGTFEAEKIRLSPFKGEGIRRRVEGEIESESGRRRIKLRVVIETNQELDRPLDRDAAKWRNRREDPMQARVLLRQIHEILMESGFRALPEEATDPGD